MRIWLFAVTATSAVLGGCNLYIQSEPAPDAYCSNAGGGGGGTGGGGGGGGWGGGVPERNPTSGWCFGAGGPPNCSCGICEPTEPPIGGAALCSGPCENLLEDACLSTTGCHTAYHFQPASIPGPNPDGTTFDSCWDIAPLPVLEGSSPGSGSSGSNDCVGLDALTCSQHDDCVSIMTIQLNSTLQYMSCQAEPGL